VTVSARVRKNARKTFKQNLIVRRARKALPGPKVEKNNLEFTVAVYKMITANLLNSTHI
jgi:hypothetical protein